MAARGCGIHVLNAFRNKVVDRRDKPGDDDVIGTTSHDMPLPAPPLLIITDRRQATRPLDEVLAAAFDAGCRWASLREKDLPDGRAGGAGATPVANGPPLRRDAHPARRAGAGARKPGSTASICRMALMPRMPAPCWGRVR